MSTKQGIEETPQVAVINSVQVIEDENLLSIGKRFSSHNSRGQMISGGEDRSKFEGFISRRGSELDFKHLCEKFGASLFEKLPKLWDCLTEFLTVTAGDGLMKEEPSIAQLGKSCEDKEPQCLINNIQVVRSVKPYFSEPLRPQLLSLLPCILGCVCAILMLLSDSSSVSARQGAGILLSLLVQGFGCGVGSLCSFPCCSCSKVYE